MLDWCSTFVRQPDGPDAGEPWMFTREQMRFVLRWYAVDVAGRWLHTRGTYRRAKGAGKSPFVAALALAELCGPVRFGGWDAEGEPVGVPVSAAWVQIAGVSERQTTNTMSMVLAMLAESPAVDEYGLDLGLSRIFTSAGGRLEPITASATTAEGARPTFIVADETHHWTESNGGVDLDRVNRRNLGKSRDGAARMLETTNAFAAGGASVAEKSHEAWLAQQEGRTRGTGILYDSREAPADTDLTDEGSLLAGLACAYGDSTWVDLLRIKAEVWDPATPVGDSRRFYLNQIAASVDAWIAAPEWQSCARPDREVAPGEAIVLGFDGSRSRARGIADATALVGVSVADGHVFTIGCWEQPDHAVGEWTVPVLDVELAVDYSFSRWTVVGMYADPNRWESVIATWEARYAAGLKVKASRDHPISAWVRPGPFARSLEQFHGAVMDGEMSHDGSSPLTRHVLNARRRPSRAGLQIGKEHPESRRKIDCAVAAVLAWDARLDALAGGYGEPEPEVETFVPRRVR